MSKKINPKNLLIKIEKTFPKVKYSNYEYIWKGWDHHIIILDNKIVFRFPKSNEYLKFLPHEINLLNYLNKRITLQIPDYTFVSPDKSFAGYKFITGTPLLVKDFQRLSVAIKKRLAQQLGKFLSQLHSTPITVAKKFSVKPTDYNTLTQTKKFENQVIKLILSRLNKKERTATKKFLIELKETVGSIKHSKLIHDDLLDCHILINKKHTQLSGVIDFSDRAIGDPALDFSALWDYGEKFIQDVAIHYGPNSNFLLRKALVYNKRRALYVMVHALDDKKYSWKDGYTRFRKLFF